MTLPQGYRLFLPILCMMLLAACSYRPAPPSATSNQTKDVKAAPSGQPTVTTLPSVLPPTPPKAPLPEAVSSSRGLPSIALLLPLSGSKSELGNSLFNAAQLALFEGSGRLQMRPYDTTTSIEAAGSAMRQARQDGARMAIGPVFGKQVTPAIRSGNMPVISFSNDTSVAGDGVYIMGFLPQQQVERVVSYAIGKELKRFAALVPNNGYGQNILTSLDKQLKQQGGTLVRRERTNSDKESLQRAWQNLLRQAPLSEKYQARLKEDERSDDGEIFDVLFIGLSGKTLTDFADIVSRDTIADTKSIQLLGTQNWQTASTLQHPALQGAWIAMPSPGSHDSFERRYRNAYGAAPHPLASMAYDAMALAVALERSGQGYTAASLENPSGFAGVDGVFRFTRKGLNERGLSVVEIRDGALREVDAAPAQFYGY